MEIRVTSHIIDRVSYVNYLQTIYLTFIGNYYEDCTHRNTKRKEVRRHKVRQVICECEIKNDRNRKISYYNWY